MRPFAPVSAFTPGSQGFARRQGGPHDSRRLRRWELVTSLITPNTFSMVTVRRTHATVPSRAHHARRCAGHCADIGRRRRQVARWFLRGRERVSVPSVMSGKRRSPNGGKRTQSINSTTASPVMVLSLSEVRQAHGQSDGVWPPLSDVDW